MTEYIASSDELGRRPRISRIRSYSSGLRPRSAQGCWRSGSLLATSTVSSRDSGRCSVTDCWLSGSVDQGGGPRLNLPADPRAPGASPQGGREKDRPISVPPLLLRGKVCRSAPAPRGSATRHHATTGE